MPSATVDVAGPAEGWGAPCCVQLADTVACATATGVVSTRGLVLGSYAIHMTMGYTGVGGAIVDPNTWTVTHMPTGSAMGPWCAELGFWDAYRVALALDDSGLCSTDDLSACDLLWMVEAVIAAALQDHYVFPLAITEIA